MRTPILLLMAVALAASACTSAAPRVAPSERVPLDHWEPTSEPWDRDEEPTPEPWDWDEEATPQLPAATPYDGVTYDDPGVNPFVPTERDRESTFGLEVDTASYAIARRYVHDGNLPDPASVRVEEFVNAFDHAYPPPHDGTFAIHADGAPTPFLERGEVLLRIGVKAREVEDEDRAPAALTFVVDTSGSMEREDRLGLVRQALSLLVDRLDRSDSVAIVSYGSEARVVLEPTSVRDADRILRVIDDLRTDGSTNAEAGLALGYQLAAGTFREEGINRVILASDGVANVGDTDPESILRRVRWDASLGIQLVTVGFGMGNYNDVLMEQLADKGDGFYAYVNTVDDARDLFGRRLTSTLQSVALDARAQVAFDPAAVEAYRLLGYENRDIPDQRFEDDTVEAGAIGAGHSVTALYALRLSGEGSGDDRIGTVRVRWTDPDTRRTGETALDIPLRAMARDFEAADASFRLDALVAAAAEVFRASRWARHYSVRDVAEVAASMEHDLPSTEQVDEFLDLLHEAGDLER